MTLYQLQKKSWKDNYGNQEMANNINSIIINTRLEHSCRRKCNNMIVTTKTIPTATIAISQSPSWRSIKSAEGKMNILLWLVGLDMRPAGGPEVSTSPKMVWPQRSCQNIQMSIQEITAGNKEIKATIEEKYTSWTLKLQNEHLQFTNEELPKRERYSLVRYFLSIRSDAHSLAPLSPLGENDAHLLAPLSPLGESDVHLLAPLFLLGESDAHLLTPLSPLGESDDHSFAPLSPSKKAMRTRGLLPITWRKQRVPNRNQNKEWPIIRQPPNEIPK